MHGSRALWCFPGTCMIYDHTVAGELPPAPTEILSPRPGYAELQGEDMQG